MLANISSIMEKLEKRRKNGGYAVLRAWLEDYEKALLKGDELTVSFDIKWMVNQAEQDRIYGQISGFIRGLNAGGVISDKEVDSALAELIAYPSSRREAVQCQK